MKEINFKDTIDQYLINNMNKTEVELLFKSLQADPPELKRVQELKSAIKTLETKWLKDDLMKAARYRKFIKLMRFFMVAFLCILIATGIILLKNKNVVSEQKTNRNQFINNTTYNAVITPARKDHYSAITLVNKMSSGKDSLNLNTTLHKDAKPPLLLIAKKPENVQDTFNIMTDKDTLIRCKSGLTLQIPALLFSDSNNKIIHGNVRVIIVSYSDYFSLFLANIHTCSGNQLLQTGGSCHITATQNNKAIKVATGKSYTLFFPAKKYDSRMIAFYGGHDSTANFDWRPEVKQPKKDTTYLLAGRDGAVFKQLSFNLKNCPDKEGMHEYLKRFEYLKPRILNKLYEDTHTRRFTFYYNAEGLLTGFDYITLNQKEFTKTDKAIMRHKRILGTARLRNVQTAGSFAVDMTSITVPQNTVQNDPTLSKATKAEFENHNRIIASEFQYINCDFFKSGVKTNMLIKGLDSARQVQVFYTGFSAVSPARINDSTAFVFNAPAGENMIIVALRYTLQEPQMSITYGKIQREMWARPWEKLDYDKIKSVLNIAAPAD